MKWTLDANETLAAFWNSNTPASPYRDKNLAGLLGTTTYAVAKQRSKLGLVTRKVAYHNRAAKSLKRALEATPFALFYKRDGQPHFMAIDNANKDIAITRGELVLASDADIKTVFVLQPVMQINKK